MEYVDVVVSGVRFVIAKQDIEKYPESFLATALKKEWHDGKKPIELDRNEELFRTIYAFLVSDRLPKTVETSGDKALLNAISKEAEY